MSILFYTAADEQYEKFAPLYIYFTLRSNPESHVEIGLEDSDRYVAENERQIEILRELFGERFKLTTVDFDCVLASTVRWITEPELADRCEYVYIGDIDILIFDDNIEEQHLNNMAEHDAPFSNIIREDKQTDGDNYRLSGLHFAPTETQYPIPDLDGLDYAIDNDVRGTDETIIYKIMKRKGVMVPEEMDFRPIHGIHMRTNNHPFGIKRRSRPDHSFEEITSGNVRTPWTGIEVEEYREEFMRCLENENFQSLFFHLDTEIKNMLMILENACMERFDQYEEEAFTYIITEAYYEELIRKGIRTAYDQGLISAGVRVIKHIQSKVKR